MRGRVREGKDDEEEKEDRSWDWGLRREEEGGGEEQKREGTEGRTEDRTEDEKSIV